MDSYKKWQRNYLLTIQVNKSTAPVANAAGKVVSGASASLDTYIKITLPYTMEFSVDRNIMASANTARITLYNLSEDTRNKIYKDRYATSIYKSIELRAGYGDDPENLPIIFKGNIRLAFSERKGGSTDYRTVIEAYDGGFAFLNSWTSRTFMDNTPVNQILERLIKDLPFVNRGAVGDFSSTPNLSRRNALNGNTAELLSEWSGDTFFIDNEKAYCLQENECILGNVLEIFSGSGLLGSPLREETYLSFDIIFEPRILVGQKISLTSETERRFNGDYKILGFSHRGTISGAVSGNAVTSAKLYYGIDSLIYAK